MLRFLYSCFCEKTKGRKEKVAVRKEKGREKDSKEGDGGGRGADLCLDWMEGG